MQLIEVWRQEHLSFQNGGCSSLIRTSNNDRKLQEGNYCELLLCCICQRLMTNNRRSVGHWLLSWWWWWWWSCWCRWCFKVDTNTGVDVTWFTAVDPQTRRDVTREWLLSGWWAESLRKENYYMCCFSEDIVSEICISVVAENFCQTFASDMSRKRSRLPV